MDASEAQKAVDKLGELLYGKHRCILVVDDEINDLATTKLAIHAVCADDVDFARTGKEALEMMKGRKYDLIIIDLRLPEMDGVELAWNIKKSYPDMPILSISGLDNGPLVNEAVKAGVSFHIKKPVTADKLRPILNWHRK